MTIDAQSRAPQVSDALIREQARILVDKGRARVLVLRAKPQWSGAESVRVGDSTVHIRGAVSQFAALDALYSLPEDDFLILLTDRTEQDLGQAVLTRTARQRIEMPEEWAVIPELFGATAVDRDLRAAGSWVPTALLDYRPARGWPKVPSGTLTRDFALRNLLARVLELPVPSDLDAIILLEALDVPACRATWNSTATPLQHSLIRWAHNALGPVASLALTAVSTGRAVSVLAVGLALDVLWPVVDQAIAVGADVAQVQARARIEPLLGVAPVPAADARALADAARSIVLRMDAADDPARTGILQQAEQLLIDLGWATGAENSAVLRTGLFARLRALADAIAASLAESSVNSGPRIEGALADVLDHQLAHREAAEVTRARMAVRLVRWLIQHSESVTASLSFAILEQAHDGAWVDRASADVWVGSADLRVAGAYGSLVAEVRMRRAGRDKAAARLLADLTSADTPLIGVVPVESLLMQVVSPIAATVPTLLIVLDGMSGAVATELAQAAAEIGWAELVPEESGRRLAALTVLPSMTTFSRTSLFAASLLAGQQADEKARFKANVRGPLFHKNNLRSEAGAMLPVPVTSAIGDRTIRVVGVVLNTIDDALAKHDPGGTHWTLEQVQHLRALLDAATLAGRAVVFTSDHGHVVERGVAGGAVVIPGADARWRSVESGPVGEGEILVQGRRVLAPGGRAVLAWREDLRYGSIAAGYHGGASLAEITIPIIVLVRPGGPTVTGWAPAAPQMPAWWNDPLVKREATDVGGVGRRRKSVAIAKEAAGKTGQSPVGATAENQLEWDFELPQQAPVSHEAPASDVVAALVESDVYAGQRARAGRRALDENTVTTILRTLLQRGGRAHRDTLATAAGVANVMIDATLAALRRLLNVDSYSVISIDSDGVTVVLDERLLREQFELGGGV